MMSVARGVSVVRDGRRIVDDVSVTLRAGRITVLLGENGAGKSTLLNVLAGVTAPTTGTALLGNDDVTAMMPLLRAHRIAWLPAQPPVPFGLRTADVVSLGLYAQPTTDAAARDALVSQALATLELSSLRERAVATLSSGERQRVGLARVLVQLTGGGVFAFLDEPTSALDVRHQLVVKDILRGLADAGVGIVVIIHDIAFAKELADDVLVMKGGRVSALSGAHDVDVAILDDAFGVRFAEQARLVAHRK